MNFFLLMSHLLFAQSDYYLPHFTMKAEQWNTEVSLYNPTLINQEITITAYDSAGNLAAKNKMVLPPGGGSFAQVQQLFPELQTDRGWLHIASESDQLQGTLQFTETQSGGSSTLPLVKQAFSQLSIPRVVQDQNWQSGFSLVNTSGQDAQLSIEIVDFHGNILASENLELGPFAKHVSMLSSLFSESDIPGQSILNLKSNQPILALGLAFSSGNRQIVALPAVATSSGQNDGELAQQLQKKLDDLVVQTDLVHSMSLGVANYKDDYNFHLASGFADPMNQIQHSPEHAFRLASVSKTFTAVLVMQLAEKAEINLDDKIAEYLPPSLMTGLHIVDGQDLTSHISIRQLLNHTSGLGDHFFDGDNNGNGTPDLLEIIFSQPDTFWTPEALIDYHKTNIDSWFAPGQGYHYSDMNYLLLGLLVEKISGQSLHQALRNSIFTPLQMNDTWLEYRELPTATLSHCFLEELDYTNYQSVSADWAGGGLASTIHDLTIFMKALLGGDLFESPNTFLQMLEFGPTDQPGYYYGLGVYLQETELGTFIGHTGFSGAFMFYWAERDMLLTGTTNQAALDEFDIFQNLVCVIAGSWRELESSQLQGDVVSALGSLFSTFSDVKEGPHIIFEAGAGSDHRAWQTVLAQVGQHASVFSYDRAGYGTSDYFGQSRAADQVVNELRGVLAAKGLAPPYILVGHSLGGLYMQYFARAYPDEVAGVVLIDSSHWAQSLCQDEACQPWWQALPEPVRSELADFPETAQLVQNAGNFPTIPLSVVTAGKDLSLDWLHMQESLANQSPISQHHIDPNSGHTIQEDNPWLVISEILRIHYLAQ